MTNGPLAIDHRSRVRIWKLRSFELIAEQRVNRGQRPIDICQKLLAENGVNEANATLHTAHGVCLWSGIAYAAVGWIGDDPIPANNRQIIPASDRPAWESDPHDDQ